MVRGDHKPRQHPLVGSWRPLTSSSPLGWFVETTNLVTSFWSSILTDPTNLLEVAGIDCTLTFPTNRPHHCAKLTIPRYKKPRAQWLACLSLQSYLYGRCSVLQLFHRQLMILVQFASFLSTTPFLYQNSFLLFSPRFFVSSGFDLSSWNTRETTCMQLS